MSIENPRQLNMPAPVGAGESSVYRSLGIEPSHLKGHPNTSATPETVQEGGFLAGEEKAFQEEPKANSEKPSWLTNVPRTSFVDRSNPDR